MVEEAYRYVKLTEKFMRFKKICPYNDHSMYITMKDIKAFNMEKHLLSNLSYNPQQYFIKL